MTEMRFILHARGQLLRGVKLYDLGTKAELYFDSITGLRPAKIVGVHDKEPEVLEDGSLAPWTMLAVQVNWGGTLGWKDELIKAERIVPASCLYGEYKNKITPFRWRSPMSTLPPVGTRVRALTSMTTHLIAEFPNTPRSVTKASSKATTVMRSRP